MIGVVTGSMIRVLGFCTETWYVRKKEWCWIEGDDAIELLDKGE